MDEPPGNTLSLYFSGDNLIYIIVSVAMLLFASVISACEGAYFSLDSSDLDTIRKRNSIKNRNIVQLLADPRLLLSVLTFWKYLMLVGCSLIFTIALNISGGERMILHSLILTVVFAFVGIILSKVFGSAHKRTTAIKFSRMLLLIVRVTKPLVKPLLRMSNKVARKLEQMAEGSSVKELTQALQLAASDKEATEEQKEILRGIVNFGTLTVDEVMRPEPEIHSVDISLNYHDLLLYIKKSGFSRLPVYRETLDKVEGVLYIKDLLPYLAETKKFNWHKLLRPAYFVPEEKKIDLLLKDFQEKRVHMALAIDHDGKVSGLITLEDIIEQIIGDIHDEFDEAGAYYKKLNDKTFVFDSKITVAEFCRILDIETETFDVERADAETLGGILADMQQDLPKIGDTIVFEPFTLVIEAIDHKRIKKIRVRLHEPKEND